MLLIGREDLNDKFIASSSREDERCLDDEAPVSLYFGFSHQNMAANPTIVAAMMKASMVEFQRKHHTPMPSATNLVAAADGTRGSLTGVAPAISPSGSEKLHRPPSLFAAVHSPPGRVNEQQRRSG